MSGTEKLQENQALGEQLGNVDVALADEMKGDALAGNDSSARSNETFSVFQALKILIDEKVQMEDASQVVKALKDLAFLLYCDGDSQKAAKNKQDAQSQAAHVSVIEAMARFESNEDVHVYGCRFFTGLFYSKGWGITDDIRLETLNYSKMKLINCIAKAVANFRTSPRVQQACMGALINILTDAGGSPFGLSATTSPPLPPRRPVAEGA